MKHDVGIWVLNTFFGNKRGAFGIHLSQENKHILALDGIQGDTNYKLITNVICMENYFKITLQLVL